MKLHMVPMRAENGNYPSSSGRSWLARKVLPHAPAPAPLTPKAPPRRPAAAAAAPQPESKLRAITSESGSWTKFLYRGNFSLTSVQSREGALEKVVADLINKDYLDTAVNVMNR